MKFKKLKQFCTDNNFELSDVLIHGRYGDGSISVTELLGLIIDPSFEYIKTNHADKLQDACDRGNKVHANAENEHKIDYKEIKTDAKIFRFHKTFCQWKILYMPRIEQKEITYHKDGVRGTIDAITGEYGIVDYKSSLKQNIKYFIQIGGYARLSGEEQGWILYMGEKNFQFVEVEDLKYYKEIFLELLEYSKTILNYNKA